MENAAKAIMIAGAALLAVLLLTLFIYATRSMGESAANIYSAMDEAQISEFNQQFLNYDNRTNLKPQEVVTLINLAKESNDTGKLDMPQIIVRLKNNESDSDENTSLYVQDNTIQEIMERLDEDVKADRTYTCQIKINTQTKLVSSVNIIKNP